MTAPSFRLSVIVASQNAKSSIGECLDVLCRQCKDDLVEIIVADNSVDGTKELIKKNFSCVKLITRPGGEHIPQLWEAGLKQASAPLVAIITAHCVPGPQWVENILKAHRERAAAVGGPIALKEDSGLVSAAIYFCRYTPFMPPVAGGPVMEIPGDNASYKKDLIDQYQEQRRHGFWEPEIHALLRRDGCQILMDPGLCIFHGRSFTFAGFVKNRFHHGRTFGAWRAAGLSLSGRALRALAFPLVPAVMFLRAAKSVFSKGRYRRKFIQSSPALVVFLCAWAVGELAGAFAPASSGAGGKA